MQIELLRAGMGRHAKVTGWRCGRLAVSRCHQALGAPLLDGGSVTLSSEVLLEEGHRAVAVEHFGGLVIRGRHGRAVSVAVKGWLVPNPHRWRPRQLWARLRWRLAGSPPPVPQAPTEGAYCSPEPPAEPDPGTCHIRLVCWGPEHHSQAWGADALRQLQLPPVCIAPVPGGRLCGEPIWAVQHEGEPARYVGRGPHTSWEHWADCLPVPEPGSPLGMAGVGQ